MKLAENIEILMKEKKIRSLRQLSLLCGIPISSLHHIKNGRVPNDWAAMARLAQCLEVSLYFLVFGKNDPIAEKAKEALFKDMLTGEFHIEMTVKKRI